MSVVSVGAGGSASSRGPRKDQVRVVDEESRRAGKLAQGRGCRRVLPGRPVPSCWS